MKNKRKRESTSVSCTTEGRYLQTEITSDKLDQVTKKED